VAGEGGGRRRRDAVFGAAIMAIGAAFLHQAGRIRKTPFDILGAAYFPRVVASVLIVLGAIVLLGALLGRRTRDSDIVMFGVAPGSAEGARSRWALAGAISILTIAYTVAIGVHRLDFFLCSAAYLALAGFLLSGGGRRAVLRATVAGTMLAGAMTLVFRHVLGVDLP
jgi:hypothetical protein